MKTIVDIFKILFNIHNIKDRETCRLSEKYWDVHDYHANKGGDGKPSHFHHYSCSKCNKRFTI